jgi:phosphoribosylformylglycinamidine synthase PurS subunit
MSKFNITIEIMPIKSVLDPQGEAIGLTLKNNSKYPASDFRVGKRIEFAMESKNKTNCMILVKELCEKFLVNEIIEKYKIKIENEKN